MPTTNRQRNAAYWLKVKQDEDRLAHYRARRNCNQRDRRSRLPKPSVPEPAPEPPNLSDADVITNWLESLMALPGPE
jgi:hypothetical protein